MAMEKKQLQFSMHHANRAIAIATCMYLTTALNRLIALEQV